VSEPYKCTKCGRTHVKGKIYDDHREFAERKPTEIPVKGQGSMGIGDDFNGVKAAPKPIEMVKVESTPNPMDRLKYVHDMKGANLNELVQGLKVSTVKENGKSAKVEISGEKKGGFWDTHALDAFLLKATRSQVKLMLDENPQVDRGGVMYKVNWRANAWESKDGVRIPFNVEEMLKYGAMIAMANGKHPGMLVKRRSKKALRGE